MGELPSHNRDIGCLAHAQSVRHNLCVQFIHGNGRGQDSAAHVGQSGQLKKALDSSVLPVKPVKNRKRHIHRNLLHSALSLNEHTFFRGIRRKYRAHGFVSPALIPDGLHAVHIEPFSLLSYPHNYHVVFFPVYMVNYIDSRHARYDVL